MSIFDESVFDNDIAFFIKNVETRIGVVDDNFVIFGVNFCNGQWVAVTWCEFSRGVPEEVHHGHVFLEIYDPHQHVGTDIRLFLKKLSRFILDSYRVCIGIIDGLKVAADIDGTVNWVVAGINVIVSDESNKFQFFG